MGCVGCVHEYKISVFMGNDNPYAALWTLVGAKLFAREDGTSPLIGFNWSNSVNNETIEVTAEVRAALGFEDVVRFEHHITETWKSIVRQPYNRRDELVEVSCPAVVTVTNELGDPRYPTAAKKLAARRMKPTVVEVDSLSLSAEELQPRATLTRQFVPEIQGNCKFISGDTPAALGDSLIERLREDGSIQ